MLAVELHCHSEASYDGYDPVEDLLARAEELGLDALAVTDHDEIEESLRAVELAPEYGLLGIPGLEVTTKAGHVLALGVREVVPPGMGFHETLDHVRALGGIAVVPHPFHMSRSGVMANITRDDLAAADAVEVYNSRLLTGRSNRKAERFCRRRGIPMTAGSDAHIAEMVGRAVTAVDVDSREVEDVLAAIREGHTSVEGRRTPWHISFQQAAAGTRRKVRERIARLLD